MKRFLPLFLILVTAIYAQTGVGGGGQSNVSGGGSGGGAGTVAGSNVFTASTSCGGQSNCVTWVDDDSTDNCGTATTAWIALINAYAGKGVPQVSILGSGNNGKAYKFTSCNLIFTNSRGVAIHLWATIDCNMSLQSCFQAGATATSGGGGSNSAVLQNFRFDCQGGTFIGGTNLTASGGNGSGFAAGIYAMPHISGTYVHGCNFGETGANQGFGVNSTLGTCSTYAVAFDNPLPTGAVTDSIIFVNSSGTTAGGCGIGNPGGAAAGSNTIQVINNIITTDGEASGSGSCGSIAVNDGGSLSSMDANNIFGFGIPILLQGIGHKIYGNQLDSTQCTAGGVSGIIQIGGSGTVGPAVIDANSIQLGGNTGFHATSFLAFQNGSAATITGFSIRDNVNNNTPTTNINMFGASPPACTPLKGTFCTEANNHKIAPFYSCAGTSTAAGWQLENHYAQCFNTGQTGNVGPTALLAFPATDAPDVVVTCNVVVVTQATTSSTLPTCVIGWTDGFSSQAQTSTITPTAASSVVDCTSNPAFAANLPVGYSCQGQLHIAPAASSNIFYSTTGYASVGGTAMAYDVNVTVSRQ